MNNIYLREIVYIPSVVPMWVLKIDYLWYRRICEKFQYQRVEI